MILASRTPFSHLWSLHMVFTRPHPDKHVYANPLSDILQQVGIGLTECLSELLKKTKSKFRGHLARRKDKPPSFVQLPPWHQRHGTPSPKLRDSNFPQVPGRGTTAPYFPNIYRGPQVNKSYESMPQINPLPKLHVTNPDPPTSPAMNDGWSTRPNISIPNSGGHLLPSNSFTMAPWPNRLKRPNRVRRHGRPRSPLENITKAPITQLNPSGTDCLELPISTQGMNAQRVRHIDELWFTTVPAETPGSPLVCSSPSSSQDHIFTSSTWLPPSWHVNLQSIEDNSPHMSVVPPIQSLGPSTTQRFSVPPRIPSLYFRAGSPFADGNFPWDQDG
ncbi:hypothetical protein PEBR_10270 [Penicillium brasilianum]|uniref:Uncharacterized protein n=1 Tax=Penicillium brasilianum TaxID=104259 RepID=A0A1S9RU39_PENBI|nr:hypothetical protein PEBR_10270 [Penicillium brasilianum]